MKLNADRYYLYFCMFEELAMFKQLSYSSQFVRNRQPWVLSTNNPYFEAKTNEQAVQMYLFQWMQLVGLVTCYLSCSLFFWGKFFLHFFGSDTCKLSTKLWFLIICQQIISALYLINMCISHKVSPIIPINPWVTNNRCRIQHIKQCFLIIGNGQFTTLLNSIAYRYMQFETLLGEFI